MPHDDLPGRRILLQALGLYAAWTLATYLLEGRLRTLLRPEDPGLRLTYALVANVLVGIVLALWVARGLVRDGVASAAELGFRSRGHAVVAALAGLVLGFAAYALQGAPTLHPMVLLNGFAQVLVVSLAEVLVCWVVLGRTTWALLRRLGSTARSIAFLLVSALSFGVYHFAHSPPFDSPRMVVFLSGVGVVTGLVFLVSRDVYGTLAFHNFLGVFGVVRALAQSERLETFALPQWPLLATAAVSLAILIGLHATWLRGRPEADA
jgi:hypothetical protein